jgi:sigma-B regulation protein RsbU (phosphoserine phosphatase)
VEERRKAPRTAFVPASIGTIDSDASALDRAVAADLVLRHLFVPPARAIDGIRYAAFYRFAEKHSGGDIIDVFRIANTDPCFSLTDISGKGVGAALHAGLVKYGIRAFASENHSPSELLRHLNDYYCGSDDFEGEDSFASVFFARYDPAKHCLSYASAGHEGLALFRSGGGVRVLEPTGPVVGILPDAPQLYSDETIDVRSGDVLIAVSDGITEARNEHELFGMDRLIAEVEAHAAPSMEDLACGIARTAATFARNRVIDDMAVLAVTFE